jgi:wyosine [tRNA(Phe)-imidazoG37] synthetase (radical SAM superfamily)
VPGVLPEKLAEGMEARHCALSLVGEPIMYPEINKFVRLLHSKVTFSPVNIFLIQESLLSVQKLYFLPLKMLVFLLPTIYIH